MSWGQAAAQGPGRAENDRNKKVNDVVRAFVGSIMKQGDIVVASDSMSKLWKDSCLKRVASVHKL